MAQRGRIDLYGWGPSGETLRAYPGQTDRGAGDLSGIARVMHAPDPDGGTSILGAPFGSEVQLYQTGTFGASPCSLKLIPALWYNGVSVGFHLNGSLHTPESLSSYSIVFDYNIPFFSASGAFSGTLLDTSVFKRIFQVKSGSTVKWGIGLIGASYSQKLAICSGTSTVVLDTGLNIYRYGNWVRWQVTVSGTTVTVTPWAPNVTTGVWEYWNGSAWSSAGGTPTSYSATISDPSGDSFDIGHFVDQSGQNAQTRDMLITVRRIAWWDTADADGNFPTTGYVHPARAKTKCYLRAAGGDVEVSTPMLRESPSDIDLEDTINSPEYFMSRRDISPGDVTYGSLVQYLSSGGSNRTRYQIAIPEGDMPDGGWPMCAFIGMGYFIGSSYQMAWVDNFTASNLMLSMGIAVAGIGVKTSLPADAGVLSALAILQGADPGDAGGDEVTFPTPIINGKQAIQHIVANRSDINPNKIFTAGHSAGAYVAESIMISRDHPGTFNGESLTLAGNGLTGPDPAILGTIAWSPPTDLAATWLKDATHPYQSLPKRLGTSVGNVRAAINMFAGVALDYSAGTATYAGTPPSELDDMNPAGWIADAPHLRPIIELTSKGDGVVADYNAIPLAAAYAAADASDMYTHCDMGHIIHDWSCRMSWAHTWTQWLRGLIAP